MIFEDKPLNLLVVEDNPGDYELLKEYLESADLSIRNIFHSARMKDVPLLIDHFTIDIVLLDLTLPDSTGIDSVIALDRLLPHTPIVVLSGLSSVELTMKAISLGAQDYLVKGEFREKLLAKTIKYSIERKKILENLQQSNARYELVNKATLDTIWDYDFVTGKGTWGEGITTLYGYPAIASQFDKTSWKQYIHPDDFEATRQHFMYCIENKMEDWQYEYRFRAASGEYKYVYARGYILYNHIGKPYRMFGAMTDITVRKKLEKELLSQKIEQQKLITDVTIRAQEKERNELGKELHDNINQILATVKIYIGMLKNKQQGNELIEKSYQYVSQAMEEIRKLSKTLVSPSLGGASLKQSLETLVNEVNVIGTPQIHLNYQIDNNQLIEDRKQLTIYRIVQEQITNIRKHARAEEATITVKAEEGNLLLTIEDDGAGFDTSQKAKGIGLQNINSRVQFYSGQMTLISQPGNGCKIEIKLPL